MNELLKMIEGCRDSGKTYVCKIFLSRNAEDDLTGTAGFVEKRLRAAYGKDRSKMREGTLWKSS